MTALPIVIYAAVAVFVIGMIMKVVAIARSPLHLRWELYPIPHDKGKASYGGSYLEDSEWWTRPREISRINEIVEIALEISLLKTLFRHNRLLWSFSLPFHLGLYLLVVLAILLKTGALLQLAGYSVTGAAAGWIQMIYYGTIVCGSAGWIMALGGGLGLLSLRIFKADLRQYSILTDYINLLILAAVCAAGLMTQVTADPTYAVSRNVFQHLITFSNPGPLPAAMTALLWLTAVLLVYFPFTHMTHFVGKYFTFHKIRWEDRPLQYDDKMEARITKALQRKVGWFSPHLPNGATWGEAAASSEKPDEKK